MESLDRCGKKGRRPFKKRKRIGGRTALSLSFAGLSAALCALLTTMSTLVVESRVRNQIRHRLRDIVAVAASRVDGDLHQTLTRPDQEGGAAYRTIQHVLQQIQRSVPDLHYVYTMRMGADNNIVFVVDEETNEAEVAHLGEIYDDAGPGLRSRFAALDAPFVENDTYTDRWGNWLSGYAPFYDSNGHRAGVLGMDIRSGDIAEARWRVVRINLWLLVLILPICAVLGWFLADRLTLRVRKLAQEARGLIQWPASGPDNGSLVEEIAAVGDALRTMRYLLDRMSDAVVATDLAGNIVYVNDAVCNTLQHPRAELLGKPVAHFGENPVCGAKQIDILSEVRSTGYWEGDVVNYAGDGSEIVFHSRVWLLRDHGGVPMGMLGVSSNITEQRRAKAEKAAMEARLHQSQKLEAVGRLAGGVAHDFNNLLMGIMGYVELSRDEIDADHPVRKYLDEITDDAQRSADLTRQLLAFARKQTVAPRVLDLNEAVEGTLNMLRRLIGEDIRLAWQPGADAGSVKMDPGQLDQVLANLCVNARDAIAGVGKVTIETENVTFDADSGAEHVEASPGDFVLLAVSDDGCGMDRETLDNMFEPFFTTKGVGQGTGLGLATVYGIVKQNNGFINAYSEPGEGTTFKIYLPRFVGKEAGRKEADRAPERIGGRETILLVEDEKSVRVTMGRFLEDLGYAVRVADTPDAALALSAEHPAAIDLLITDVVMPGMNGRALAEKLATDHPSMKVLYMSGYTANVIAHRGILEEGVQFMSKPVGRDELARKVREVLGA